MFQVQQLFAVLKLRKMLRRKIEAKCLLCGKRKAQTLTAMMADVPKDRLALQSPPFTLTCPFFVEVPRSSAKR